MKINSILIVLILAVTGIASAQIKSIVLIDNSTNIPIPSATVQSDNTGFFVISDENGFINLSRISEATNSLLIKCIGFESQIISYSNIIFENNTAIISLSPKISSLDEVIIKTSSPNSVFKSISDLDIHLRPINNSQEILRMVPGLFIGQHAGGGKAEQIFVRGFDIDHGTDINITVDGLPVNMVSHAHGQGYADLHFVIPELIDNVNFNKGPYFADKGNFTTAGFVAFKTKDYLEQNFIRAEGGQFGTFRGVAGLNLLKTDENRRNQSLYFVGEASVTEGYFDSPQDFSRFNGTLKYHGSLGENNFLTATATAFTSKWNASGQIPLRAVESGLIGFYGAIDDTEGGETSRFNLNTELLTNFKNGGTLRNQLFYVKNEFELYSNFTFFKEDRINGDQIRQKENRSILGYNSVYQNEYMIGELKTSTQAGIQVRYDDVNDVELTRTRNRTIDITPVMLGDVNELNIGTYYSQKIALNDKLDVTGALRFDYFNNKYNDQISLEKLSSHSTILSPKLNFDYQLNDKIQLYFYNGKGFHSNDTRVAVQQNGRKALPPAYGSDLGSILKIGKKLVVQSAIWYLWLDQEFVYVGDEGIVEAGGRTQRFGIDASARYEVAKNLYADFDLSLAKPRALNTPSQESFLPLAPTFTHVGGLTYRKQYGWNGSLRYRFMGDRPANKTNSLVAEGYFIMDGAVNYTTKKWEVGFSVQNILNTEWKETQFETESQLLTENTPVSEIHFTPGTPFFAKLSLTIQL